MSSSQSSPLDPAAQPIDPVPATEVASWDDEVDVLCWLRLTRAARLLSYERDAAVLDAFCVMAHEASVEHRALG
jgi:hypothetical protein